MAVCAAQPLAAVQLISRALLCFSETLLHQLTVYQRIGAAAQFGTSATQPRTLCAHVCVCACVHVALSICLYFVCKYFSSPCKYQLTSWPLLFDCGLLPHGCNGKISNQLQVVACTMI